jgi:cysteine desulfurase
MRGKPRLHLEAQIHGGGQERDLRSGTLAVHQIVGMGEACHIAYEEMSEEQARILKLRQHFWHEIKELGDVYINGDLQQRIAGSLNISFGGVVGEVLIAALKDLAVSSAAACGSAVLEPSHVLHAIGVKRELAQSAIRFCFGRFTTKEEVDYAISHVKEVVKSLRACS